MKTSCQGLTDSFELVLCDPVPGVCNSLVDTHAVYTVVKLLQVRSCSIYFKLPLQGFGKTCPSLGQRSNGQQM